MDQATRRLNLLFLDKASLLAKDTGLRVPLSTPKADPTNGQSASIKKIDASLERSKGILGETPANKNQESAARSEGSQTAMVQKEDNVRDEMLSERSPFEASPVSPASLLAQSFCPAVAITKLPYKYMRGETARSIAHRFFDQGQFWSREWNLYYIFPPRELSPAPLLLLSASQVQEFLNLISAEFKISLNIPNDSELGILLSFEEEGMPKPEFLGLSTDRASKDKLVATIELPSVAGDFGPSFRQKMEAALVANRKKSKESLEKGRLLKIERQRNWVQSLKRAQCYLGLLPRYSGQKNQLLPTDLIALPLPTLYLDRVAPFPSPDQPIFVSVDLEWNERHHNQITEVGISTLDTADIACVPPGNAGENWRRRIRSGHIRVKEFKHIVNRDFVSGCPDKFDFGKSEFVSRQDVARVIEDCFKPSHVAQIPKILGKDIATGTELRPPRKEEAREHKLRPRNVVLVGHGLQGDITCLRALGCRLSPSDTLQFPANGSPSTSRPLPEEIPASPIIWDTLDTATMFQALKRDAQPRALMNVLNSLNIPFQNLHNAGNDARCTLEVMLGIIINARAVLDEKPQERPGNYVDWAVRPSGDAYAALYRDAWQAEVDWRVSEEIANSEDRIRDDCRIWEVATGWDSEQSLTFADLDGGDPKGLNVE